MQPEDILQEMMAYEKFHDVTRYRYFDWHVWPALRMYVSWQLYIHQVLTSYKQNSPDPNVVEKLKLKFLRLAQCLYGATRNIRRDFPSTIPCEVVFLTYANRIQRKGNAYYHYLVDPFVEILKEKGISLDVWEFGDYAKTLPRCIKHSYCQSHYDFERAILLLLNKDDKSSEPDWFTEYSRWAAELLGSAVTWPMVYRELNRIQIGSRVIGKWLRRADCSALFVDCWYSAQSASAVLAANRLGIQSIDIQHGLQEGFFPYSGWTRIPEKGYEAVPSVFWVWGQDGLKMLNGSNSKGFIKNKVVAGGNLWTNKWLDNPYPDFQADVDKASALTAGFRKTIVVTLQTGIDCDEVFDSIQNSPKDWRWFIRPHRKKQSNDLMEKIKNVAHPGVDAENAKTLPLYALMAVCDSHLTWFSTCALEALSFGVPTVILHPRGFDAYQSYIQKGVMLKADTNDQIIDRLVACERIDRLRCKDVARNIFSPLKDSSRAIHELLFSGKSSKNKVR